jgi:Family of unknown function (DUF5309)
MSNYLQGFLGTYQAGIEARNDVTVAVRNWFANRNPLVTRLPYVPVERTDFLMYTHPYRSRSTTITVALASSTTTGLTLGDATFLMNHDVLQLVDTGSGDAEFVQVNGDPTGTNTITVTRGVANTTALATYASATTTVYLIGNSRTGAEVNQTGLTSIGTARTQYCQTFQFPVQIGGSAQTARAQVMPGGIQSPFDFNMTVQLQNMVDDIETSCYYGMAQAPTADAGSPNDNTSDTATTAKMNGLRNIFVSNNINSTLGTTPTNASAYGSSDLIRDTLQAARTGGGEPDLLIVSTNFMSGFATWGQAVQRIPAGETVFGTPISVFEAPFLHGVTIVEAPLLRPYTAIALTSSEIYIRNKRNPYWNLRGNRGDMVEGDWIAEMAIEVVNESHHAWVEGITAFSAN